MDLSSCFIIKKLLKISQATGLRDLNCGCSLSPSVFLRQGAREIKAGSLTCPSSFIPPGDGALTVIRVSTLPQGR